MKLIVGLGNPGEKYLLTRHNIGFMAIDILAESKSVEHKRERDSKRPLLKQALKRFFQKKRQSLIQKTQISGQPALLAKPQTFMNLSGRAVQEIMGFYKIPLDDLLVIQDDKDLPFQSMKFQKSRGHGGHNGIKNIHEALGSNGYARLKLGIGQRPAGQAQRAAGQIFLRR